MVSALSCDRRCRYRIQVSTARASTSSQRAAAPVGKEEVVAAVLRSAADLFAERGLAATSIRDIATRSRVNHGLIHRHFGSKDSLVAAVLDHLGQHLAELLAEKADGKKVADYPVGELQSRFPTMGVLLDAVRPQHPSDLSARLAAAHTIALQLGWVLFGDFLRASTGLEDMDDRTFVRSVGETAASILF